MYRLGGVKVLANETTRRSLAALCALPLALLGFPARGDDIAPSMDGTPRLAIGGYDTVAYHTVGKAVPGKLEYQTLWHDARWQFSSKENLDLFTRNPEKYAAQYDGHCAMGVAYGDGHKDTVDPEAFTIVNGKLYLNHTKYWTTEWRKNEAENIRRADQNWATVKDEPEPIK
jgi:YHS domain-containing protein